MTTIKEIALVVSIDAAVALTTPASQVEITAPEQDPQASNPLNCLNFVAGGSIRPQLQDMAGNDGKSGYKRDGSDGGTCFCFAADYYLSDDISWVSYYELGVSFPAMFSWDNYYAGDASDTTRRMLYIGLKGAIWGTPTFDRQNSIRYDVVGARTGIQDYDMIGQTPGNSVNGDYDGSYRTRKFLEYKKTAGDVDPYASYLFSSDYNPSSGLCYKRKDGGSLGADCHITDDLIRGTAQSYTRVEIRGNVSKIYDQNIVGTTLSWKPDNWTFSLGGGWYQNFMTIKKVSVNDYFAGDTWGLEYFAGYTFPVDQYALKSVQPCFMGDRIEYVNGRDYPHIDNGMEISFQPDCGLRVDYECVLTSSTGNLDDMSLVCLCYDS